MSKDTVKKVKIQSQNTIKFLQIGCLIKDSYPEHINTFYATIIKRELN